MDPISTFQLGCVLYVQKMRSGDDEPITVEWLPRLVAWILRTFRKSLPAFANHDTQEPARFEPNVERVAN